MIKNSSSNNHFEVLKFLCIPHIVTTVKRRKGAIKNHKAPIKKSLQSYQLFQWRNLIMKVHGSYSPCKDNLPK